MVKKISKKSKEQSDDETEYTFSDLDINLKPQPAKAVGSSLGSVRLQPQQELKTLENTQSVQLSTCKLPRDDPCGTCMCKGCNKDEDIFHISLSKIKSLKELLTEELTGEKSNQMIVDSLVDKISEMIKNIE